MKKILYFILIISLFIQVGCDDKKVDNKNSSQDQYSSTFTWFPIGVKEFRLVDTYFSVTDVAYTYVDNLYKVSGNITNLTSVPMYQVNIMGVIENKSKNNRFTTGNTEINLPSGTRTYFEIKIPTSETNVSMVGLQIINWRM